MTNFSLILDILLGIITLSLLVSFIRLYIGPNVPNRTVAFDTIAVHAVGMLAIYAVDSDAMALLDVAIVTAVLGFLGTTMLARYLERAGHRYRIQQDDIQQDDEVEGAPQGRLEVGEE